MEHPGYLLNPGDMYQVEPDVVQHATGDRLNKEEKKIRKIYVLRAKKIDKRKAAHFKSYLRRDVLPAPKPSTHRDEPQKRLYWLKKFRNFWAYIHTKYTTFEPTRKIKYRQLKKSVENLVSKWYEMPWKELDTAMKKVALEYRGARIRFPRETPARQEWLTRRLAIDRKHKAEKRRRNLMRRNPKLRAKYEKKHGVRLALKKYPDPPKSEPKTDSPSSSLPPLTARIPKIDPRFSNPPGINIYMGEIEKLPIIKKQPYPGYTYKLNHKRRKRIKNVGISLESGKKTYPLPWRPKPYMSAFAFIPRYLEVRQNICAGVYLRHPVARPGLSEVPSPFPSETMQLAYNWYLRRR